MTEMAKRMGRPLKAAPRGKRVSLGLKVTAEIKRRIDTAARATGRTQSQEAERRIELSYSYERAFSDLERARTQIAQTLENEMEQLLERRGYKRVLSVRWGGSIWLPPGRLQVEPTRWVAPDDHTPPAAPKIVPDPGFVELVEVIARTVKAELEQGRGS